jgi:hypothetical protein
LNSVEKGHIEVNESRVARLIISGEWLYDGIVPKPVRIFALNYDYYFQLDEGYHDDGEKPELNSEGEQYVVVWHNEPFFSASDFPSNGFMNVTDAKSYAASVVQKVKWQEPVTDRYV